MGLRAFLRLTAGKASIVSVPEKVVGSWRAGRAVPAHTTNVESLLP